MEFQYHINDDNVAMFTLQFVYLGVGSHETSLTIRKFRCLAVQSSGMNRDNILNAVVDQGEGLGAEKSYF